MNEKWFFNIKSVSYGWVQKFRLTASSWSILSEHSFQEATNSPDNRFLYRKFLKIIELFSVFIFFGFIASGDFMKLVLNSKKVTADNSRSQMTQKFDTQKNQFHVNWKHLAFVLGTESVLVDFPPHFVRLGCRNFARQINCNQLAHKWAAIKGLIKLNGFIFCVYFAFCSNF